MSDDSLDFIVLFILPVSESLKWNKILFYLYQREMECPSQSNCSLLSDLYSVEGCHSLEVSFTEIYTFLCSISLVRFLSTLYLWPILFTLGWKKKLSLGFSDTKKNIEKNRPCCHRHWPLFRHSSHSLLFHFCIFLKTQGEYFVSWIQKTFCDAYPVYLLLFQHRRERAEYITGDEKDQFDIVMQTSSNTHI